MIKAVHFFSNAWAANFWSAFHPKRVPSEFKQIKRDGFNTIILLLPWRGFQRDISKPELNQDYLKRLRFLFQTAKRMKLKVILRVSYPHYFCPHSIGAPRLRIERILREEKIRMKWFHFLSLIGSLASEYSNFEYAFISWEDFWHIFTGFQQRKPDLRKEIARSLKYDIYITENVDLSIYNNGLLDNETPVKNNSDVEIPGPQSLRHKFYLDFINQQLNEILNQARDYISPLIMEIRVDKDSYLDDKGKRHWYTNDLQIQSQLPRLTYWAPFIGAENNGEKLSSGQALANFSHLLQEITSSGENTQHIINQFNFIDETPSFKGTHAEIEKNQLPDFMSGAAKLLQKNSAGYGLWAYRDYYQNLLFNPAMAQGHEGWKIIGEDVKFPNHITRGKFLLLKGEAALEQQFCFVERGVGKVWLANSKYLYFTLETYSSPFYRASSVAGIELTFAGRKPETININKGVITGAFDITDIADDKKEYTFKIANTKGRAYISTAYLYFYEFKNHVYDTLGKPDEHRNLIVQFNKDLDLTKRQRPK